MGSIEITVDGAPRAADAIGPHTSLLDWLREQGRTSAKEGCAEGECGACAVLVARPDGGGATRWTAVNACLPPALAFDGQEIVTAEGLGSAPSPGAAGELHPVQREMAERGGSQCGYCTPGFVCAMAAEYYRPDRAAAARPTGARDRPQDGRSEGSRPDEQRRPGEQAALGDHAAHGAQAAHGECGPNGFDLHALSGNLCRCTGYRPIRDAAYALGTPAAEDALAHRRAEAPPSARPTVVRGERGAFVRPADLHELTELLAQTPEALLLAGATDAGVERNLRHARPPLVLAIDRLEALRELLVTDDAIELGAALTLSEIEHGIAGRVPMLDALLPQFASRLIRNAATLGGNLGTGSPIGDSPPALLALEATLLLVSASGEREVPLAEYFTGYRQSVRAPGEVIRAVRIPLPLAPLTAFHKIAKRRFDDISAVAVAFALTLDDGLVTTARIGLGGVAATPIRALAAERALEGRTWNEETARAAAAVLRGEGTPLDDHRASARYRSAMLEQSLLRLHAESVI
ncbi:xanthine dehydrogenase small subunit [Agrococcus baldri]|uniref:Xanthine dehydrogenase small subunit n=1 Tax=Agrococcus baldri TaxID=153730 RepID=A0AA94KY91_9MICO|nr:FAD binding domain-containing protein [Agrococcus baldri]SFR96783.1 xanthine dehydrogenase small subunit [Agrococcus baldri]